MALRTQDVSSAIPVHRTPGYNVHIDHDKVFNIAVYFLHTILNLDYIFFKF